MRFPLFINSIRAESHYCCTLASSRAACKTWKHKHTEHTHTHTKIQKNKTHIHTRPHHSLIHTDTSAYTYTHTLTTQKDKHTHTNSHTNPAAHLHGPRKGQQLHALSLRQSRIGQDHGTQ